MDNPQITQISQIRNKEQRAKGEELSAKCTLLLPLCSLLSNLCNLRTIVPTSAPTTCAAHPQPSRLPAQPVPSDPKACTSLADALDPEPHNNLCKCSGELHRRDRVSLLQTNR